MKQNSLRMNYILNIVHSVTTLLFPLITFPYASRILLADGIGEVAFLKSIISYITILSALGLPFYAVREIAKVRDNPIERSKVAIEIIFLHSILTLLGYFIVAILCISINSIYQDLYLFLLLSTSIFLNAIGAIWFYQGIEDFQYITIRGFIVKIVSMILLFTCVKTKSDLIYYAATNVIAEGGGNIFNFVRLRKYINYKKLDIRKLNYKRHLKPALRTFILNISTSIYLNLDSVMLGFLGTHSAVGFYTAANAIVRPSMTIVTSLGSVILPRLSNLIGNSQTEEFKSLVKKTMHFGLFTSIPMTLGLIILAQPIISVFCGSEFGASILTTQIMSPIIIAVTLSCFMLPILYAAKLEQIPLTATIIGAAINLIFNFILIPHYLEIGAAIGTLIAESCVTSYMFIRGRKYVDWGIKINSIIIYLISSIIMSIILISIMNIFSINDIYTILICLPLGILIYIICLLLFKEKMMHNILSTIRK